MITEIIPSFGDSLDQREDNRAKDRQNSAVRGKTEVARRRDFAKCQKNGLRSGRGHIGLSRSSFLDPFKKINVVAIGSYCGLP